MANKGAEFRRDFLLTCATQAAQANPFGDSKKEYHHGFMSRNDWGPNHIHCKSLRCRVLPAEVVRCLENPGQQNFDAFLVRSASSVGPAHHFK